MTASEVNPQAGVGELLRAGREQAGLSLEQVAAELRLSPAVIRALEADDDAALPEPPYVRGYLRAYAKLVGLQEAEVLERYRARHPEPVEPGLGSRERPSLDGPPAARTAALALAVLAVLAAGLWWYLDEPKPAPSAADGEEVGVESVAPASTAPQRPAPAAEAPPAVIEFPPLLPEQPVDEPMPLADAQAPAAEAATQLSEPTPPAAAAQPSETPDPPADEPAPPAADGDRLELVFRQDSWVEVEDADGRRLLYGLVSAGQRRSLQGPAPFSIMLGNAPGVEVSVNGRAVDFSRRVRADNTVRFRAPQ